MALDPSDFLLSLLPSPINVVLGRTGTANLLFSNTSATERGYNLSAEMVLPDGVSFVDATIPPTSVVPGPSGTIIVSWINVTDLSPNQIDYGIAITLQSDETFRQTGLPVPFDTPLVDVSLSGTVDTLPRGDDDPGNIKITKIDASDFIPLRYDLQKSAPGKIPKGAGILPPPPTPFWIYEYTLTLTNNTVQPSTITLVDDFANGIRYLNNLVVTGPDTAALSSPTVIVPTPGPSCQDFTTLDWGTVTLSTNSINTITFDAAIWDNYTIGCIENSGAKIAHNTPLENTATLDGASGPVVAQVETLAMDTIINKSISTNITDVGQIITYTLSYSINQYDDVGDVVITDLIGDGQTYNIGSATVPPTTITTFPNGTTQLVWNIGLLTTTTTGSISFTTTVNPFYANGDPVAADCTIVNDVTIDGINQTTITPTPDNAGVIAYIGRPTIEKQVLNYYYKDGSPKLYNVSSPGDEVEFIITYDSLGLNAEQLDIQVDEYAPQNMGPLTATLPITYGGTLGTSFVPVTVTPNGLRWFLGTVPGNSFWTATFRVPVQNIEFVGARNNLTKLAGRNTPEQAYSDRDQVVVDFGKPNVQMNKTVSGPDVNNIKFGEIYTYSITISNPQDAEGLVTDAFEMDLTDVIPDGLAYNGTYSVTGTGSYDPPVFAGQNISMTITQLAPDDSLTFNYSVTVGMVVSGDRYINNAILQRPYSQPDRSYQYTGLPLRDSVSLITSTVNFEKQVTPTSVKIGDLVTYTLTVVVPVGTAAYDLQVTDTFPSATQEYQIGSATKDGVPILPSVVGGLVVFPTITLVNATLAEVSIVYEFQVRIINGTHIPPFIESQVDDAAVTWTDLLGTTINTIEDSANVLVQTPNLISLKQQRNVTQGSPSTVLPVTYEVGDVIEYRITLTNNGAESAYNIILTDVIDSSLQIIPASVSVTLGTTSVVSDTITWTIPILPVSTSAELIFSVNTLEGVAPEQSIFDFATFEYSTNNNGFEVTYGPEQTNSVEIVSENIFIEKQVSTILAMIGDIVTYTVIVVVPKGTIIYNFQLTDTIPLGQQYNNNATLDGVPITATESGNIISFPIIPIIDTMSAAVVLTYIFEVVITDIGIGASGKQTNKATANWFTDPTTPAPPISAEVDIFVPCNNVILEKKQKKYQNCCCNYTKKSICATKCPYVKYQLCLKNCCPFTIYNILITDILPSDVNFNCFECTPNQSKNCKFGIYNDTVVWEISELSKGATISIEYSVKLKKDADARIYNKATVEYTPNKSFPETITLESNEVLFYNMYYKMIKDIVIVETPSGCTATIIFGDKEMPFC